MTELEERIRTATLMLVETSPPPPRFEDLVASAPRQRPRRRLVTLVVVLVPAALVLALILGVIDGPRSSTKGNNPGPVTQPGPGVVALGPRITQPDVLAAGKGKLWVTGISPDQGSASLQEIDEATGKVLSTISLPDNWPGEIAVGDNAIWLRTQQGEESTHLVKIVVATHQIMANVTLQKDGGLAVTPDAVWTVNGSLGLLRIDPQTGHTVAAVALPGGLYAPLGLASGPLGVFLGSSYDGSVLRVDEQNNTVSLVTHIGTRVDQMVELGTSLWVSTGTALVEMTASTGVVGQTIDLGAPVLSLASDGHWLWVLTDKPKLGAVRIDPVSGQISHVQLPTDVTNVFAVTSDPTTGEVWATASSPDPSLVRLELQP